MKPYLQYLLSFIGLVAIGVIYEKVKSHPLYNEEFRHYALVKKFMVLDGIDETESDKERLKRPILWIHLAYEPNARHWVDFYSRKTMDYNQPYQYLTLKSVLDKCSRDFNVCLIQDDSFQKLIPSWNIDMERVAHPIRDKMRELGMAHILHTYGGIRLPPGLLCLKPLLPLYHRYISSQNQMFIGELKASGDTLNSIETMPSTQFMGCHKGCEWMKEYIRYLELLLSKDYTHESIFTDAYSRWWFEMKQKHQREINVIPSELFGVKDTQGKLISIERLFGNTYIDFNPNVIGIVFPQEEIIRRSKYEWFSRCSIQQALESDTILGKLLGSVHSIPV
jgi:hypothetical protein